MEILVTRQLNTAHKQVKHLAVEQSKLKELAKKTENADYFSRLEQKIVDYDEAINILKKKQENNFNMVEKIIENKNKASSKFRNNNLQRSEDTYKAIDSLLNSQFHTLQVPARIRNHKYGKFSSIQSSSSNFDNDFNPAKITLSDMSKNPVARELLAVKNKTAKVNSWLESCEKQREEINDKTKIFESKIEAQIQTAVANEYTEEDIYRCLKINDKSK